MKAIIIIIIIIVIITLIIAITITNCPVLSVNVTQLSVMRYKSSPGNVTWRNRALNLGGFYGQFKECKTQTLANVNKLPLFFPRHRFQKPTIPVERGSQVSSPGSPHHSTLQDPYSPAQVLGPRSGGDRKVCAALYFQARFRLSSNLRIAL